MRRVRTWTPEMDERLLSLVRSTEGKNAGPIRWKYIVNSMKDRYNISCTKKSIENRLALLKQKGVATARSIISHGYLASDPKKVAQARNEQETAQVQTELYCEEDCQQTNLASARCCWRRTRRSSRWKEKRRYCSEIFAASLIATSSSVP